MLPTIVCLLEKKEKGIAANGPTDARGHYTIGKEMVDSVIDRIRRVAGTRPNVSWDLILADER